jgi:hypothetical protein
MALKSVTNGFHAIKAEHFAVGMATMNGLLTGKMMVQKCALLADQ